jgi:hypothetical protein
MDNAYIAGLFDGEGCIVVSQNGIDGTMGLRASISNSYKPALDLVAAQYGGRVCLAKLGKGHKHTVWSWYISGRDAARFLEALYPYLIIKREQALVALRFQETMKQSSAGQVLPRALVEVREALRRELQELKKIDFTNEGNTVSLRPLKKYVDADAFIDELNRS